MTFGDHIPFLDREIATLGQKPFDLPYSTFLEVLRGPGTEAADEACRVYATTLQWPTVSDRVRLELCMRLSCALWWCKECAKQDVEDETGQEFIEGTLIEYWHEVGRRDWLWENYCLTPEEKRAMRRSLE